MQSFSNVQIFLYLFLCALSPDDSVHGADDTVREKTCGFLPAAVSSHADEKPHAVFRVGPRSRTESSGVPCSVV